MSIMIFPPEIIDIFFSHLHPDRHALGDCSLVCKTWLPIARFHLLSDISARFSTAEHDSRLTELLSSPLCSMLSFLRRVHLQGSYFSFPLHVVSETSSAIRSLCRIRTLELEDLTWPLVPSELKCIASTFDLTSLSLSGTIFQSPNNLSAFISSFPHLCTLSLGQGIRWLEPSCDLSTLKDLKYLHTVSMHDTSQGLMTLLLRLAASSPIHTLELRFTSTPQNCLIDELLCKMSMSLKHLTLDLRSLWRGPVAFNCDLGSHLELRSLTFREPRLLWMDDSEEAWTGFFALLTSIKSRNMESLTLGLQPINSKEDYEKVDWLGFDDVLTGDILQSLRRVNLRVSGSQPTTIGAIKASLPKTSSRNLLDVEFTETSIPAA
ncbi:hypothetical protein AMATHDRAFT_54853 [Amanita thiersii Skay4041]|uniref:F-box domain-containing protein n=1 Tax=Amanita thiersii Skay4041 TaxID=703135 RepID=A0A2A9NSW2_9AGAR|nr:hypothetical protein AMATHDRAFT_54853 [Amanita thiersii Skay4041]